MKTKSLSALWALSRIHRRHLWYSWFQSFSLQLQICNSSLPPFLQNQAARENTALSCSFHSFSIFILPFCILQALSSLPSDHSIAHLVHVPSLPLHLLPTSGLHRTHRHWPIHSLAYLRIISVLSWKGGWYKILDSPTSSRLWDK